MNPHLKNAFSNGFRIPEVAEFGCLDARQYARLSANVFQCAEPGIKFARSENRIHRRSVFSWVRICQLEPYKASTEQWTEENAPKMRRKRGAQRFMAHRSTPRRRRPLLCSQST